MTDYRKGLTGSTHLHSAMFAHRPRIAGLNFGQPVFAPEGGNEGGGSEEIDEGSKEVEGAGKEKPADKGGDQGKGNVSDGDAKLLRDLMKNKDENKTLKEQLKRFEGIDPDAVRTLLAEAQTAKEAREAAEAAAEEERARASGNYDALKSRMSAEHEKVVKTKDEELSARDKALAKAQETIHELTVGAAFANSSFISDKTVLTTRLARSQFERYFDVVDGKVQGFDRPRDVEGREPLVNAKGQALPFDDAIAALIEKDDDRDRLLKTTIKPGAGSRSDSGVAREQPKKTELRGAARIAAAMEKRAKG